MIELRVIAFAILILFVALPAFAYDWNKEEIFLEITWEILHIMDWGTTLDIAERPDEYTELNPILGGHPDRGDVNLVMGAFAVLHPLITAVIPRDAVWFGYKVKPRRIFQCLSIGTKAFAVGNNLSIGLTFNF